MTLGLAWWYVSVCCVVLWTALAVGIVTAGVIEAVRWVRRRW